MKIDSFKMLLAAGFVNAFIIGSLVWLHYWAAAVSWLAGILIFFPFFAAVRQILEHRNELAEKKADYTKIVHGKISRLFTSDLFSRVLGGAGFNKHMIHHWDPQISYTRLIEIENFLLKCEGTKKIVSASRTTYFKTFKKLVIKNFKS